MVEGVVTLLGTVSKDPSAVCGNTCNADADLTVAWVDGKRKFLRRKEAICQAPWG